MRKKDSKRACANYRNDPNSDFGMTEEIPKGKASVLHDLHSPYKNMLRLFRGSRRSRTDVGVICSLLLFIPLAQKVG